MYMMWILTEQCNITMNCGSWPLKAILAVMRGWGMMALLGMRMPNLQCCVDCLLVVCLPTRGLRHTNDCGAQQTVLHVSWECPLYANDGVVFTAMLSEDVDALPVCTKYAGIIPIACTLTNVQTVALHRMLLTIWQKHIKSFHEGERAHQESSRMKEPVNEDYISTMCRFRVRGGVRHLQDWMLLSMTCTTNITKGDIRLRGTGEWERPQGKTMRGSSHVCYVFGSGDGMFEYPICQELFAMVRLGRATVLRGRLHRGC